ncbi:unnamed protein product [Leptidea sinapis]|uniref:CHK kinase-like domain-containing protein n=1 Tax=Leptidea sinapis TaxID=189913 RepID=A0A5E4QZZ7_9NEOP|nr:unnamed protein product [Leptidea sinapis]
MIITKKRLNEIVSHISKNYGLQTWRFICQDMTDNIENYFGILIPLTIIGTKEDCETEINIFLKVPPIYAAPRLKPIYEYLFNTECYIYGTIIPLYKTTSNYGRIEEFIPEHYFIDSAPEQHVVALKNMVSEGFKRYNKERFLDFDHTLVALKTLAQFHAFWVILEKKGKAPKDKLIRPYNDTHPKEYNITLKLALKNHVKHFAKTKYEEFLKSLYTRFDEIRVESSTKAKRMLLGHGDYWKENILFKYKEGKPIQACILDFQTSRLLSPAQDFLSFLLYSHFSPSRLQNFDHFLTVYLETFHLTLRDNNIDLLTYTEEIRHDFRVVAKDCVITSFMAFALWVGLEDDTLVKSKEANIKNDSNLQFTNLITHILDDLSALGFITL